VAEIKLQRSKNKFKVVNMCELHNTENKQMLNFCSNTVNHATVYISYHWSAMSI